MPQGALLLIGITLGAVQLGVAQPQFSDLTAPGDGENLFFSSSQPLRGSGGVLQSRLYSVGSMPVTLLAEGPTPTVPEKPPFALESAWFTSDYYRYLRRDASRDRSVVATTVARDCHGGYGCYNVEPCETIISGPDRSNSILRGKGWLSANGRWLVTAECGFPSQSTITNLQTGQQSSGPAIQPTAMGRIISDNGIAILNGNGSLYLFRDGAIAKNPISQGVGRVGNAVITGDGNTVLYDVPGPLLEQRTVRIYRTDTGRDALFSPPNANAYAPSISNDGSLILYLSTGELSTGGGAGNLPQLYSVSSTPFGTSTTKVTNDADGVRAYAGSDIGPTVWYVSGSGRIVKVDVSSRNAEEKVARTPGLDAILSSVSPGSLLTINGTGIPAAEKVKVRVGEMAAPVIGTTSTQIRVQIPWELPAADVPAQVNVEVAMEAPESPFETTLRVHTDNYANNPRLLPAIHGDWSGIVSEISPAHPGEVVYFYATGLGPVTPSVATGSPGPINSPARTVAAYTCNARVLFSGLAPGVVGYYQLAVQLPATLPDSSFNLICNGPGLSKDQTVATFPVSRD